MAQTELNTDNALTKKAWEEKLFRDTVKETYFSKFMGQGKGSIVQVKNALLKGKGDQITFGIRMRLTGDPITGNGTLEGNEQKLTTHDYSILLERYRFGVRDRGELTRQRAVFSVDTESREALQEQGVEHVDALCFDAVQANPTKIFYGGTASSTANITATDKITPAIISRTRVWSLTGGNRAQTPLRPIMIKGKKYFVLLVHPDVMYDLKQDSTFAQARREALERGRENPIFSGSEAVWDGVVVHEHENMDIVSNWGSGGNVPGARCTLMGAQALVYAWGARPKIVPKKFDYDEQHGYGWGITARCGKPVFDGADYGSVAMYVARTQVSDG